MKESEIISGICEQPLCQAVSHKWPYKNPEVPARVACDILLQRKALSMAGAHTNSSIHELPHELILILNDVMRYADSVAEVGRTDFRGKRFNAWKKDLKGYNSLSNLTQPAMVEEISRQCRLWSWSLNHAWCRLISRREQTGSCTEQSKSRSQAVVTSQMDGRPSSSHRDSSSPSSCG